MSAWDRRAELKRFERMFDTAEDPEELLARIGTPTKAAVDLARDFVATPPPDTSRWDNLPAPLPDPEPETPPEESADVPPQEKRALRGGGLAVFLLLLLAIGLPVAALLLCVGLPFLVLGAALLETVVEVELAGLGAFNLFSDLLLTLGAGFVLAAAGVLLAWLGLWLSVSLCRKWALGVLYPLSRRLCYGKEDEDL